MELLRSYLRTLNPPLPTSVRTLQAGALVNALGNGLAYPFLFIYLHNVRGIDLATAGLIVGTNSAVGLVAGPIIGSLIDRVGGRVTLGASLWLMAVGSAATPSSRIRGRDSSPARSPGLETAASGRASPR